MAGTRKRGRMMVTVKMLAMKVANHRLVTCKDLDKSVSMTAMSFDMRFRIRPAGVTSKYRIGECRTLENPNI